MASVATAPDVSSAVAAEAVRGLSASPKTLSPWLFYDEAGSRLFEEITALPEYYLTRTERGILAANAEAMLALAAGGQPLTLVELGAGTATKTGILLRAATRMQQGVLYQPVDVSASALDEARGLERAIAGVRVRPRVANYITEPVRFERPTGTRILALYIGSSIGNFSPEEAEGILRNLRADLQPGDALLLGTDLAPGAHKSVETLVRAYDDAAGVTAAFNMNVLARLNRELGADFHLECFGHRARWNAAESRMEMHLEALAARVVTLRASAAGPAVRVAFAAGETIHTENSYKFTEASVGALLAGAGFGYVESWRDAAGLFAVTLAVVG